jgi:WD40 repeat protein
MWWNMSSSNSRAAENTMDTNVAPPASIHDVFISYSRKDTAFARRLDKALREYRPPRDLAVPQRHLRVFLDQEDFTGVEYQGSVAKHLRESAKLVVLCSPHARRSPFVDDEIRRFAESNGVGNIIPILVSGIPNNEAAPGQGDQLAFPAALCAVMDMPLAVDYRALDPARDKVNGGAFHGAWYTTLANIYDTSRDQLEQREKKREARRRRITRSIVAAVMTVLAVALAITVVFWRQAVNQRTIAVARQLAAQAALVRNQRPDLLERTVLLATESLKRAPSLEADLVFRPTLALLARHVSSIAYGQEVADTAFSPDVKYVALGAGDTVRLVELSTGRALHELRTTKPFSAAAFSPDGRYLATASGSVLLSNGDERATQLWDVSSGKELARVRHEEPADHVAFNVDGSQLASRVSNDVLISEVPSGQQRALLHHERTVLAMAFSPRDRLMVTATNDRLLHIWNLDGSGEAMTIAHDDITNAVVFSPDGKYFATSGRTTRVWDVVSGAEVSRAPHVSGESMAFSPDGEILAAASGDLVILSETASGRETARLQHGAAVKQVVFAGSEFVAVASYDDTARIWTIEGQEVTRVPERFANRVAFSGDGRLFASAGSGGTAHLWERTDSREATDVHVTAIPVVSRDGRYLATVHDQRRVIVQDALTGRTVGRFEYDGGVGDAPEAVVFGSTGTAIVAVIADRTVHVVSLGETRELASITDAAPIAGARLSPDAKYLATWNHEKQVRLWALPSGKPVASMPHNDSVERVEFSPDSRRLVTVPVNDSMVFVWDTAGGRQLAQMTFEGTLSDLAFDSGSRYLAAANYERGIVLLWDLTDGHEVSRLAIESPFRVVFSPDGRFVAGGGLDGTVRIWKTGTTDEIARLAHGGQILDIVFSGDAGSIATASGDDSVRVWEAATGSELARIPQRATPLGVQFVDGDQRLLTSTSNGQIRTWLLRAGDQVREACLRVTRNLTREEWRQYVGDEPYEATCSNLPAPTPGS